MDGYKNDQLVKMKEKDKKKKLLWTVGGLFICGHVTKNAIAQFLTMSGLYTPPIYTRLSAFQATLHFPSTIVSAGSGANVGIQLIHSILGSVGQAGIGNIFNNSVVQRRL
jgi:hypothetical protein